MFERKLAEPATPHLSDTIDTLNLDLAEASVLGDAGDNARSSSSRSNVLALEVGQEASGTHVGE
jgi:hypothetical protein